MPPPLPEPPGVAGLPPWLPRLAPRLARLVPRLARLAPSLARLSPWLVRMAGVLGRSLHAWVDHRASSKGAALAFYTLFSMTPILILAIAGAGYFSAPPPPRARSSRNSRPWSATMARRRSPRCWPGRATRPPAWPPP